MSCKIPQQGVHRLCYRRPVQSLIPLVCPSNHTMEADVKGRAVFTFPFIHFSLGYFGTLSAPSHRSL